MFAYTISYSVELYNSLVNHLFRKLTSLRHFTKYFDHKHFQLYMVYMYTYTL